MRRNIIPIKNSNRNSHQNNSNTRQSIISHINKISSMLNAPYIPTVANKAQTTQQNRIKK